MTARTCATSPFGRENKRLLPFRNENFYVRTDRFDNFKPKLKNRNLFNHDIASGNESRGRHVRSPTKLVTWFIYLNWRILTSERVNAHFTNSWSCHLLPLFLVLKLQANLAKNKTINYFFCQNLVYIDYGITKFSCSKIKRSP